MGDDSANARRIVILGGGFGGAYCAASLERSLKGTGAEVMLIDRNNYFIFYPLLVEAGTGSLEPRHTVVSVRRFAPSARFVMAEVTEVDVQRQVVSFRMGEDGRTESAEYDHLVLALGSVTSLPPVPGLEEHAFTMKTLGDATALRNRAIRLLELANATPDRERRRALLRFVVVGANFTGVEVTGEFHQYLREATRLYPNVEADDCSVVLIEIMDRILTAISDDLADYAARKLRDRGVEILLEETVSEVHGDHVKLRSGKRIDTQTVIWCAGVAPPPLVSALSLPVDDRGYIKCDRDLRVAGMRNVWAIGDAASNPDPDGKPYPPTAQHAIRQATHLARCLSQALRGKSPRPCDIKMRGSIASLGGRSAVARVFGRRLSGGPAWFLYRTFYLLKMPGWGRRLRVALDWTVNLFFRRDIVQLDLRRSRQIGQSSADGG